MVVHRREEEDEGGRDRKGCEEGKASGPNPATLALHVICHVATTK